MTTFNELTGEAWMRSVSKRLSQLERLPRSNGSVAASTLDTNATFEADSLMSSGLLADPSLVGAAPVTVDEAGEDVLDPFMIEDYDPVVPVEARTDLQFTAPTPSLPIVESRTGSVAVSWDGLCAGGTAPPVNLLLVEVHRSIDSLFEPDESTYAGSFLDSGLITYMDQTFEVSWFYRFVLLTTDGERSTATDAVEGIAHKIETTEVGFSASEIDFDGVIAAAAGVADDALAAANGKNTVWHKTYAPTAEPNIEGDTWFQHDATTGVIVAQFTGQGGTTWLGTTLSHQVISSVDLGTATVGKLSANYIDSGILDAAVTLSGYVLAGNPTGGRVVLDEAGFRQYTNASDLRVNIPTDPLIPSQFEGAFIAETLTVTDGIAIRGILNEVSKGGSLYLSSGTTAPTSKPSVSITYDRYDGDITMFLYNNRGFHHDSDGADPYFAGEFFGYGKVVAPSGLYYEYPQITLNGSSTSTRQIVSTTMVRTTGGGVRMVMYVGRGVNGDVSRTWGLELLDPSSMTNTGTVAPTIKAWLAHGTPNYVIYYRIGRAYSSPATTTLDTNFALVEYNTYATPDQVTFRRFSCTESAITQQGADLVVNTPFTSGDEECIGVTYGSSAKMNFPGTDQMIWLLHGSVATYAYSAAGTRLPDFDFYTASGDKVVGSLGSLALGAMTFGGFRMAPSYRPAEDQPLNITKYTNNHWVTGTSSTWWASCTWYDPDGTGGTHETTQSARAALTMRKRASLAVTVPVFPARPFPTTTDDVTASRIYLSRGSTDPGRTYMEYVDVVNEPTRTLRIGDFTFPAGTAAVPPPATSNFSASAPAALLPAATTNWQLVGDGSATLGGITVSTSGTTNAVLNQMQVSDTYVTADGILAPDMRGKFFGPSDNTGLALASSTAVAMGSRGGEGTFVAPPSGAIIVGYGGLIQARTAGVYAAVSFELRTGGTVGSGTVVQGYDFNTTTALNYTATLVNVWNEFSITGLTPGSTYNIRNMAASADTTAGANAYRARCVVRPQL